MSSFRWINSAQHWCKNLMLLSFALSIQRPVFSRTLNKYSLLFVCWMVCRQNCNQHYHVLFIHTHKHTMKSSVDNKTNISHPPTRYSLTYSHQTFRNAKIFVQCKFLRQVKRREKEREEEQERRRAIILTGCRGSLVWWAPREVCFHSSPCPFHICLTRSWTEQNELWRVEAGRSLLLLFKSFFWFIFLSWQSNVLIMIKVFVG